jgi:membrane-associated phospholipid phosphatase
MSMFGKHSHQLSDRPGSTASPVGGRAPFGSKRLVVTLVGALCCAPVLLAQAPARADDPPPQPSRVEWSPSWPRFRLWEYAGTAAFGAATWYVDRNNPPLAEPRWRGGILFDDAARGWLRAGTPEGRARANQVSNVLWLGGSAVPFVIDLPVALLVHGQPQVAWQLLAMDLEAYAVAGFVNRTLHFEVARGRPDLADCAANPGYDELCGGPSNNASFPSGHALGIATAAGLTCVHHRYLPLYGHPVADGGACGFMVLATVVTAATRIMADRHHGTDVLAGAAIGFGSGYGIPWLLHYRYGRASDETVALSSGPVLLPFAGSTELGVAMVGTL